MLYHQITFAERYTLGVLRQRGLSTAAIARLLHCHRSTIGREVRRNRAHSDGTYRPPLADGHARGRRSRSRRNPHPARLQSDRYETEPPATPAARVPHSGGMLCGMTLSATLQS